MTADDILAAAMTPRLHARALWRLRPGLWAIALIAAACGDDRTVVIVDAKAADAPPQAADASPEVDAPPSLGWVDFTITGCASIEGETCVGPAPLAVTLTAVTPAPVDIYRWQFGDGSPEDLSPSPVHTYAQPGSYDISLTVGGPGGTATRDRMAAVTVVPAALGAACDSDAQCATGRCLCGEGQACPAGLAAGLCTATCDAETPCAQGVCANLAPSAPAQPADWQAALCLPACTGDDDCARGFSCQGFLAGDGTGWISGCLPAGLLAPVGASCRDGDGNPDPARCAGGLCLDAGARGLCSADCTTLPCPASSACATLADQGTVCVARCDEDTPCDTDPGLACQSPADGGFTVDETPHPAGYCTPASE